jgi:hypothetical protein
MLSQAKTLSHPASATTPPWSSPFAATACSGNVKSSIPSMFSQGTPANSGNQKMRKGTEDYPDLSDAPAVALRMLEGTQHLFSQDFREYGPAHPARARLRDIRRAVTAA